MPTCAACGLALDNNKSISYYPFPTNPDQREQWLSCIQTFRYGWTPDKDSVLCAAHFDIDSYHRNVPIYGLPATVCYGLKQTAQPTCNLPSLSRNAKNALIKSVGCGKAAVATDDVHRKQPSSSNPDNASANYDTDSASSEDSPKREVGPSMQEQHKKGKGTLDERERKDEVLILSSSDEDGSDNEFTVEIFEEKASSVASNEQPTPEMKSNWFNPQHRMDHIMSLIRNIDREIERGTKKWNEFKQDGEMEESHFDKISAAYLPKLRRHMQEVKAPLAANRHWQLNHAGQNLTLRDELIIPCLGELKASSAVCPFCRFRFTTMKEVVGHACLAKNKCAKSDQWTKVCDVQLPKGLKHLLRRQRYFKSKRRFKKVFKPIYCESQESGGDSTVDGADFLSKELESSLYSSCPKMSLELGAVTGWDIQSGEAKVKPGSDLDPAKMVLSQNRLSKQDKSKKAKKSKKKKKLMKMKKKDKKYEITEKEKKKEDKKREITVTEMSEEKKRKKKKKNKKNKKKKKHASKDRVTLGKAYQFIRQSSCVFDKLDGLPQQSEFSIDPGILDFANLTTAGNFSKENVFPVSIMPSALLVENMSSGWIEDPLVDQAPDRESRPLDLFDADLSTNHQETTRADQLDPLLGSGSTFGQQFSSKDSTSEPLASNDLTSQIDSVFQEQLSVVGLTNPPLSNCNGTAVSLIERQRAGEPFDSESSISLPSASTCVGLGGQIRSETRAEENTEIPNNPCEVGFTGTNIIIPSSCYKSVNGASQSSKDLSVYSDSASPGVSAINEPSQMMDSVNPSNTNLPVHSSAGQPNLENGLTSSGMVEPYKVGLSTLWNGIQTPNVSSLAPIRLRTEKKVNAVPSPDGLQTVSAYKQPPPLAPIKPQTQRTAIVIPSPDGPQAESANNGLPRGAHNVSGMPVSQSAIKQLGKFVVKKQCHDPTTSVGCVQGSGALPVQSRKTSSDSDDMVYRYVITNDTLAKTLPVEITAEASRETSLLGGASDASQTSASNRILDVCGSHSSSNNLPSIVAQTPNSNVPPCNFSLQVPINVKLGSLARDVPESNSTINLRALGLAENLRDTNSHQVQSLPQNSMNSNSHQVQPLTHKSLDVNHQAEQLLTNNCQLQNPDTSFRCYTCGSKYRSVEDLSGHQCTDTFTGGSNGSTSDLQLNRIKTEPLDEIE